MKRIGILTAGGDTPALNATIHGAVTRANQLKIEIVGLIKGFNCLFNPRVPHVHLNPLYQEIPELDPTKGGTLIGSSRDYVDPEQKDDLDMVAVAPAKARHRGTDLHRRRRDVERTAAAGGAAAGGAGAQDN
jgi:6-phosphofructokinase